MNIFNGLDSVDYYLFFRRDMNNNLVLTKLSVYNTYQKFVIVEKIEVIDHTQCNMVLSTKSKGKDPPFIM